MANILIKLQCYYKNMTLKKKQWILLCLYTATFLVTLCIAMNPFWNEGKSFVWCVDGMTVQYPAFQYLGRFLRSIFWGIQGGTGIPLYEFSIGMGSDIIQFLSMWYFEPITVLSAMVPQEYSEILYNVLVYARLYLIGASFLYFCKYFKRYNIYAVLGAIIYTFSGYTFFFIKHPMLYTGLIYLPILIVGIDKIIKSQKISLLLVFMVCVSSITSYYFLYVNTIMCGVYFLIRYFVLFKTGKIKSFGVCFGKIFLAWIWGMAMGMAVLLPTIYSYLNSNRTDSIISTPSLFYYGNKWFRNLFVHMFSPAEDTRFWLYNGYAVITLLTITILFMLKQKYRELKYSFAVICIFFSMPLFTFILYAFNSINHRWSYVCGLVLAMSAVIGLPAMMGLERKRIKYLYLIALLYSLLVIIGDKKLNIRNIYTVLTCAFLWISLALILYFYTEKKEPFMYKCTLVILVVFQCGINGYYGYSTGIGNYISEFLDKGSVYNTILKTSSYVDIDDASFYRREAANNQLIHVNSSLVGEYNGISMCTNQQTKYLQRFNDDLENRANTITEMYDLDNRTMLETLCGVKYFTYKKGEENYIPFGYTLKKKEKRSIVLQNDNYLPLGVAYSSVLDNGSFHNMTAIEKQEAMLQGLYLDGKLSKDYPITDVNLTSQNMEYEIKEMSGVKNKGTKYKVNAPGGYITFSFNGLQNVETYFRVTGYSADKLGAVDIDIPVKTWIDGEEFSKTFKVRSATNQYTVPGKYDYLVNLGYHESALNEIVLVFPEIGEYEIKEIQIVCQPMEQYQYSVENLKGSTLQNLQIETNSLSGNIELDEDKLLYLSLPYSKGWAAYVDGEKTEVLCANEMFMAIPLTKGSHSISLKYFTPGLKIGLLCTGVASILFFGVIIVKSYMRIKKGRE